MKIGIIQGRLSRPVEGFQECPVDWRREFDLLPEIGLNHIENLQELLEMLWVNITLTVTVQFTNQW